MNVLKIWVLLLFLLPMGVQAQQICVQSSTLNLRSTPNTSGAIITKLSKGTEVLVQYKENSEWVYVSANGQKGFVATQYLGKCQVYNNEFDYTPSRTTPSTTARTSSQATTRRYETPNTSSNKTVLICSSPNAYAYHAYQCRGLNRCSRPIVQMSESQARAQNYRPCQICH